MRGISNKHAKRGAMSNFDLFLIFLSYFLTYLQGQSLMIRKEKKKSTLNRSVGETANWNGFKQQSKTSVEDNK